MIHPLVDHFLEAAAAGRSASPEATAQMAVALRAWLWDPRATVETIVGHGSLSLQGRRAARDKLLRDVRSRLDPGLHPRAAARAILNIRAALKRRGDGARTAIEDLVEAISLIDPPIPEEKQLARILGRRFD